MSVVALETTKRDPVTERFAFREQIRKRIREELEVIKGRRKTAKAWNASMRLLEQLEAHKPRTACADTVVRTEKLVATRLLRMQRTAKLLEPDQRRDLLIILMFGADGKLPRDSLEKACAILKLRGSKADMQDVCRVFPGFKHVFTDN